MVDQTISAKPTTSAGQDNILAMWFLCHFYEMPKFLFMVWQNYLLFGLDYFSIPLLLKTLFSPWRRMSWQFPKRFDIGEYASVIVSDIFSRILGAFMRIILIILGMVFEFLFFIAGAAAIICWLLLPFLTILALFFFLGV
jgi:hypothetical protein